MLAQKYYGKNITSFRIKYDPTVFPLTLMKWKIKDKPPTSAVLIANVTIMKILMVSENKTDKKLDIKIMRTYLYILFLHLLFTVDNEKLKTSQVLFKSIL